MSRPTLRPKTTILQFRKKVPKDILKVAKGKSLGFKIDDFLVNVTLGSEITFSLRTRDPLTAKLRHAQALLQLEGHLKAIRTGPQPLTKRDRVAVSGLLYRAFADHLEADPGDPEIWQKVQESHLKVHLPNGRQHGLKVSVAIPVGFTSAPSVTLDRVGKAVLDTFPLQDLPKAPPRKPEQVPNPFAQ